MRLGSQERGGATFPFDADFDDTHDGIPVSCVVCGGGCFPDDCAPAPRKDAAAAAVREVKEETGIDAEVVGLVGVREAHTGPDRGWMSGKTNIFFVFLLRPTTTEIAMQESEIADCKWMEFAAYEQNMTKKMVPGSLYHELSVLALEAFDGKVEGFAARPFDLGFRPGSNMLYSPAREGSDGDDAAEPPAPTSRPTTAGPTLAPTSAPTPVPAAPTAGAPTPSTPASGSAEKGKKTFKQKCSQCHTYEAVSLTAPAPSLADGPSVRLVMCLLACGLNARCCSLPKVCPRVLMIHTADSVDPNAWMSRVARTRSARTSTASSAARLGRLKASRTPRQT